ncbi:LysE family translocator [Chromobacterium phragmitis]|uniref:LysE family transporter n=1 Tax=Chromobacterium phragmitis TaxID=2202141 RepID=A0ABV0J011_9NEIS
MIAAYLPEFIALATVHFLAVVAPGPDFAVTVSQSVRHGRKTGLLTALGIGCGISVHVAYTLLGIGALLHASEHLMLGAKLLGCSYLACLAIKLLRAHPAASGLEPAADAPSPGPTGAKAFSTGFLTNATNPKATLFFLAIFTTLVSADTPLKVQTFYGVWMCAVNAAWFALVSLLFSKASVRAAFIRMGHWFERMMGLILIGFAARLVLSL